MAVWRIDVQAGALDAEPLGARLAAVLATVDHASRIDTPPQVAEAEWTDICVRKLGNEFWRRVTVRYVCCWSCMQRPCLALTFVPAAPCTLCWLEQEAAVHIADVRWPAARRTISLALLPVERLLARAATGARAAAPRTPTAASAAAATLAATATPDQASRTFLRPATQQPHAPRLDRAWLHKQVEDLPFNLAERSFFGDGQLAGHAFGALKWAQLLWYLYQQLARAALETRETPTPLRDVLAAVNRRLAPSDASSTPRSPRGAATAPHEVAAASDPMNRELDGRLEAAVDKFLNDLPPLDLGSNEALRVTSSTVTLLMVRAPSLLLTFPGGAMAACHACCLVRPAEVASLD